MLLISRLQRHPNVFCFFVFLYTFTIYSDYLYWLLLELWFLTLLVTPYLLLFCKVGGGGWRRFAHFCWSQSLFFIALIQAFLGGLMTKGPCLSIQMVCKTWPNISNTFNTIQYHSIPLRVLWCQHICIHQVSRI